MVKRGKRKAVKKSSNVDNIFILIALIVLNVMFVIHFLLGVIGVILGLIAGAFGITVAGLVGFITSVAYPFITNSSIIENISFGGVHPIGVAFLSVALFCLGGLWIIGDYYIVKYFIKAMKWYVNLNIRAFKKYEP